MAGLAAAMTGYAAVCPTLAHVPAEVVGIWKKLGEWVNLMAKHNSRMAKHEPNVAKNDTRKAKHKPRIMTPNVRIIKTRTVRGVFIQIPRVRALASKKLLSYCINVYDFC